MNILNQINQAAIDYNKTKKSEFKDKWYSLIKRFNENYNTLYAKKATSLYPRKYRKV
jgi:hypothetical protein